ncbi:MAG: hypothetical protein KF893_26990 [Caldilineaceae bacterium]|nr:hypothetical protein [Caldilineaceae bacterium]
MEINLEAGQIIHPTYTQIGSHREINFSVTVSGASSVELSIHNGDGERWRGVAGGGETLWGTTTLTVGSNQFSLQNSGETSALVQFKLFNLAEAPYVWQGRSLPDGQNSDARVHFPQSGLYRFDFGVNNGSRYEFLLDEHYIRKMVTGATSVIYYVEAGVHDIQLVQDGTGGIVEWQIDIHYTGTASDELPYQKRGDEIAEEWLPIFIDSARPVNLVITTTHSLSTTLNVRVLNNAGAVISGSNRVIIGGETLWSTFNLTQGINLIHLTARGGVASYTLMADALPTAPYRWQGKAITKGQNSQARLSFPAAGLYKFTFSNAEGRHQFLVGDQLIQKTVESNTEVTYFVPAGAHRLAVVPDAVRGADWSVTISAAGAAVDALPYAKKGGSLGGAGNGFSAEWLPVALAGATQMNISIKTTGSLSDTLRLDVYPTGSQNPSASYQILGGEKAWTSFPLAAGTNRLHLVASSNGAPMTYDLSLRAMPQAGEASWDGVALDDGHHSTITINFPTDGVYSFALQADTGFANLLMDDVDLRRVQLPSAPGIETAASGRQASSVSAVYQRAVTAGSHKIRVVQDASFPTTRWKATIAPVTGSADSTFLSFQGTLAAGASINQFYGALVGPLDFNFSMTANGGDVDLAISGDAPLWAQTILDGETIWGTATLTELNQIQLSEASGATASIDLKLSHLPTVDTLWQGKSNPSGVDSHIRVAFPNSGMHTFLFERGSSGRYQFLTNERFIQKTVESNTEVTYFVPAGTHDLFIRPDNGAGAEWSVSIRADAVEADTLPYTKKGGSIGGVDNDFSAEWLPVHLGSNTRVNVVITVTGRMDDALLLQVWDDSNNTMTAQPIWGAETVWTTTLLPQDARLHLLTDPNNEDRLNYEIAIHPIPEIDYGWTGQSLAAGINPEVQLLAPVKGIYRVAVTILEGFIDFGQIAPVPPLSQRQGNGNIVFDLPLDAGVYNFVGQQSRTMPVSRWAVDVTLLAPAALTVVGLEPESAPVSQPQTLVISGENFIEPTVHLIAETITYTLEILSMTSSTLTVDVPGSLPAQTYDLMVSDSGGREILLPDAFTVEGAILYMPSIHRQ